jgi:site-specific recombinase XerD
MNTTLSYPCIAEFQQFVQLKDYRPCTQRRYVGYLCQLAVHFQCDPTLLREDQLRDYFVYLRQHRHYGGSAMTLVRAALRGFYFDWLARHDWRVFDQLQIRREEPLPFVLSRAEVARVLASVRAWRFRTCLRLIYHCGLRVGEAVRVEVTHIDAAGLRLRVCDGKGGKDRYVPLAPAALVELRLWWKWHRHPRWLFPSPGTGWKNDPAARAAAMRAADAPLSVAAVQLAFRLARDTAGLRVPATVHTLRHSYATHLLEQGVSLRLISQYLGHKSLDTTAIYLHLTSVSEAQTRAALEALYQAVTP